MAADESHLCHGRHKAGHDTVRVGVNTGWYHTSGPKADSPPNGRWAGIVSICHAAACRDPLATPCVDQSTLTLIGKTVVELQRNEGDGPAAPRKCIEHPWRGFIERDRRKQARTLRHECSKKKRRSRLISFRRTAGRFCHLSCRSPEPVRAAPASEPLVQRTEVIALRFCAQACSSEP
jgi:hypothetical protein